VGSSAAGSHLPVVEALEGLVQERRDPDRVCSEEAVPSAAVPRPQAHPTADCSRTAAAPHPTTASSRSELLEPIE